jgi:hypothetical protein
VTIPSLSGANRDITVKLRCYSSDHQQKFNRMKGMAAENSTGITNTVQYTNNSSNIPTQKGNFATALPIPYRPIPAIVLGLLYEPNRRVTVYI